MQRGRNPRFPTTPRGRGILRRLVQSPTNLRIDALRYMPGTRLGEEERQFLGGNGDNSAGIATRLCSTARRSECPSQRSEPGSHSFDGSFQGYQCSPHSHFKKILSRGILNSITFFSGNKTDSARKWIETIEDLGRASGWQIQTY